MINLYPNTVLAIMSLVPGAQFVLRDDDLSTMEWHDERQRPTDAAIQAELTRMIAEYESKEYQRQRAIEYPSVGDQLDALFHSGAFPPDMAAKIQAIKDKYPKA